MTKYLFSDVDGTLLQNDDIDKKVIEKIHKFIEAGNKVLLATGRMEEDIKIIEKYIGIQGDYRISQNGVIIINKNDELEHKVLINKEDVQNIVKFLYSLEGVNVEVSTPLARYATKERPNNHSYKFTSHIKIADNLAQNLINLDVTLFEISLFLLLSQEEQVISRVKEYINNNYKDTLQGLITSPGCFEIFPKNASKGQAIEYIANKHNINSADIYVIGDSYNDISMFERFKNSYVIKDANEEVSNKANYKVANVAELIEELGY